MAAGSSSKKTARQPWMVRTAFPGSLSTAKPHCFSGCCSAACAYELLLTQCSSELIRCCSPNHPHFLTLVWLLADGFLAIDSAPCSTGRAHKGSSEGSGKRQELHSGSAAQGWAQWSEDQDRLQARGQAACWKAGAQGWRPPARDGSRQDARRARAAGCCRLMSVRGECRLLATIWRSCELKRLGCCTRQKDTIERTQPKGEGLFGGLAVIWRWLAFLGFCECMNNDLPEMPPLLDRPAVGPCCTHH